MALRKLAIVTDWKSGLNLLKFNSGRKAKGEITLLESLVCEVIGTRVKVKLKCKILKQGAVRAPLRSAVGEGVTN